MKILITVMIALAASCASVAPNAGEVTASPAPTATDAVCGEVAKYVKSIGTKLDARNLEWVHSTKVVACGVHDDNETGFAIFSITGKGDLPGGDVYQVIILRKIAGQWTSLAEVPLMAFSEGRILMWFNPKPSLVWPQARERPSEGPHSTDL